MQDWITRDNCVALMRSALARIGETDPDLVSIDLDGNDLYVLEAILQSGVRPSLVVVEYNGKFPPPIRFCIDYDPGFSWDGSDYFGASLQCFVDLMARYGYHLVCCNVTGLNAFFVSDSVVNLFPESSWEVKKKFVAPEYCGFFRAGHRPSPLTVQDFLR